MNTMQYKPREPSAKTIAREQEAARRRLVKEMAAPAKAEARARRKQIDKLIRQANKLLRRGD